MNVIIIFYHSSLAIFSFAMYHLSWQCETLVSITIVCLSRHLLRCRPFDSAAIWFRTERVFGHSSFTSSFGLLVVGLSVAWLAGLCSVTLCSWSEFSFGACCRVLSVRMLVHTHTLHCERWSQRHTFSQVMIPSTIQWLAEVYR